MLRPLIRTLLQQADDYISQPVPPKDDYVSPPLSPVEMRQLDLIHELAERTGNIELQVYSINISNAYMNGDTSRVRQEMFDAVRHVKKLYPRDEGL
jgi:hypothetical protein